MSTHAVVEALVAASGDPVAALVLKATLTMGAALLAIRAARGASASLRHLVAAAAFGVLLLLPLAAALVPERPIAVAPAVAAAAPAAMTQAVAPPETVVRPPAATLPPARARGIDARGVAIAVYLLGVAAFGLSLLAGLARLARVRRDAEVSVAGTRLANEAARREGLPGGIEVAVSSALAVPITFGWSSPVILLPAEAAGWEPADRARAIRHEIEHIARGDWAAHVMSRAALALYWPHPLAWALWRTLRLEAERACDDAVIRGRGEAEPYAEQLVTLARRLRGRGPVPALSMATRSTLGQRVDAILDDRQRRAPRSRATALVAFAAGLACVLALAPVRVVFAKSQAVGNGIAGGIPGGIAGGVAGGVEEDDDDEEDESLDMRLLNAAERGDVERMRRLLDDGARADAVLEGDGTPLIAAARAGQLDAMHLLIAAGADVNRGVDGDGNALTMAARGGHLAAVRLLLDRGADIDLGVPGDGNALIMAAGAGRLDVVRFLVESGAAIEKIVPGDENPLIHAAEGGQAEVVRYLLSKGADVNARVWADAGPRRGAGEWRTALKMARRNGHEDVVRILEQAGARE
jgi:beta-lactamase regulating signal transducer with metallopeptidase domain